MAQQYTRREIREKFVEMLNERPLSKITVKELVTACGINRNTFYYYYQDLYAILEEIFQTELQKVIDEYNDTLSWEESFLIATKLCLENKKAIYYVYNSIEKGQLERFLFGAAGNVMNHFVESRSAGIRASANDKKLIASFYQCALTEMLLHWIGDGMKEEPEKIIRRAGFLFDGSIETSLRRSAEQSKNW